MRTGALLTVINLIRLARIARSRWRISLGLCGVLLEVLSHIALAGPVRGTADLLGLGVVLFGWLKSAEPAGDRRAGMPQAGWRSPG